MLKRLVGVITVRDGWAVQSIGYNKYLPLGRPEVLAENLDRWLLDEILVVCIDRTRQGLGPDTRTLGKISERGLMTPLTYGGGILSAKQALDVVKLGADRICIEHIYNSSLDECFKIRDAVGIQAVVRALPLQIGLGGTLYRIDYLSHKTWPFIPSSLLERGEGLFSEIMVIDRSGDGGVNAFDTRLLVPFASLPFQVIAFGGITERCQVKVLLDRPEVSAVAVGNSLNYRELANRDLLAPLEMQSARSTSLGEQTRGPRQW